MVDENPPELNADWIEAKDQFAREYVRDIQVYEVHCFFNTKSKFDFEGMGAFNVLNEGVILKIFIKRQGTDSVKNVYLQQNDGTWARGKPNKNYTVEMSFDGIGKTETLFTLILSIETDNGVKKRIIVKKYKNPA